MDYPIIAGIILGLLLIGAVALLLFKKFAKKDLEADNSKYPEGHYMGIGIALGIPLGLPIGLAMGNIAFGPAIGVGIGLAIGAALEQKYKDKIRPLTKKEKEERYKFTLIGVALVALGLLAFVAFFFMANQ